MGIEGRPEQEGVEPEKSEERDLVEQLSVEVLIDGVMTHLEEVVGILRELQEKHAQRHAEARHLIKHLSSRLVAISCSIRALDQLLSGVTVVRLIDLLDVHPEADLPPDPGPGLKGGADAEPEAGQSGSGQGPG